jgi:hypothetical protein
MVVPQACDHDGHPVIKITELVAPHLMHHFMALLGRLLWDE